MTLQKVMKIIVTNGVNFSLEIGSCCLVVNTNGWSSNASELTNSPRSLNINSTGAKYIKYMYFANAGKFFNFKVVTLTSNSKGGTGAYYNSFWNDYYDSAAILFVYDGSYYLSLYTPLNEYNDSD